MVGLAHKALREQQSPRREAKEYLEILLLAARCGESQIGAAIRFLTWWQADADRRGNGRDDEENAPELPTNIFIEAVSFVIFDNLLRREERSMTARQ